MSGAVQAAAIRFDESKMLALFHVGRAFKHHVLEQVGEAAAAFLLRPGADVVDDVNGDDR